MKRLFYFTTLLFVTTNLFAQIPVKGLVAWYPFSGNANDYTDNKNNGTVNGATLTTDRFGNTNSAYSFDGVSSFIEILDSELLRGKNISISSWIKINAFQTSSIISKLTYNTAENEQYYIGLTSDSVQFSVKHNSNCNPGLGWLHNYNKGFSIINSWSHIGVTCSDTSTKIFLNGNLVSELKSNTQIDYCIGGNIFIGKNWLNDKRFFNGSIDDIRIYNRVLSQNEISSIVNENVCVSNITVTDTLKISSITGINELPSDFGVIKVYPNPAHDILTISVSNPTNYYSIQITNNLGTVVYSASLNSASTQINLGSIGSKGLYFIKILDLSNNILDTRKLVLE